MQSLARSTEHAGIVLVSAMPSGCNVDSPQPLPGVDSVLNQVSHRWMSWVFVVTCLMVVCQSSWNRQAYAFQEQPVAETAPAEPPAASVADDSALTAQKNESFLLWMIQASGIFGFLIGIVSLVMIALIVAQMLQLQKDNYIPAAFVEDFERLLNEKNYQGAYEAAKANDSFIAKVLAGGMGRLSRGYGDALQGMQDVGEEETLIMEQSIGYLALIGSIGPMLGLLGTVQGMISSFQVIATSVVAPKPDQLAGGIATALFTTLEGLVVAIPAIICFNLFKNRLARFVMEAGFVSEELMKRFQGMGKPVAAPAPFARAATVSATTTAAPTA